MADLLIELLSEEIPARMQAAAAADFRRLLTERLTAAGLTHEAAEATVTPRRLVLTVTGLPAKQPDRTDERKGPRPEAPPQAIEGFLKGCGLTSLKQAELRQTDKGAFYFAVRRIEGQATATVLPALIGEAVHALSWPKSMRWPGASLRWVRPLHSVLAVFDGKKLRGALPLGEGLSLPFTDATVGHRFLAPKRVSVSGFADYRAKLKRAKVLLDPAERRAEIETQAKKIATQAKLSLKDDPALLDELAGLVEWPVVLMGRIDARFMDLPPEVLTTSMRAHQRYLALADGKGKLADRFLLVANMVTGDKGKTIIAGNERVLRARLADARFFWDQDRKRTLESRIADLDGVVFHARLGSLGDKVRRIETLAKNIAKQPKLNFSAELAGEAAKLAKADLVSGMVGEFPELQGVMGRYYALHDGAHAEVAQAIAEHYSPLGPNDACPTAPVSVAVALADKIDTLVGFFLANEKPTGSKDPYALRRATLGVIRLILNNELRLQLSDVFSTSYQAYRGQKIPQLEKILDDQESTLRGATIEETLGNVYDRIVVQPLREFFADRLKVALKDKGVRHDLIASVFALPGWDDLVRLLARVEALEAFLRSDDGANLLVAYQRAANIVRIEEKKYKTTYDGASLDTDLLAKEQSEAKALAGQVFLAEKEAAESLEREDFTAAMAALARLRRPVDAFFDKVTVNCDKADLRANRLRLLARIGTTLGRVADFSKIEG
jgi:glycyl-tRNA synthetase beta chain